MTRWLFLALCLVFAAPPARARLVLPPQLADLSLAQTESGTPAREAGADTDLSQPQVTERHSLTINVPSRQLLSLHEMHVETCRKLGGHILESRVISDAYGGGAHLRVRVPNHVLDTFLETLRQGPARIVRHTREGEDRTRTLTDLDGRLKAKRTFRDSLIRMLEMKPSSDVQEVLKIEKEVSRVQQEIEEPTSNEAYLEMMTSRTTLDISYGIPESEEGVDLSPLGRGWARAKALFVQNLSEMLILGGRFLPWILGGLFLLAALFVIVRRRCGSPGKDSFFARIKQRFTRKPPPAADLGDEDS